MLVAINFCSEDYLCGRLLRCANGLSWILLIDKSFGFFWFPGPLPRPFLSLRW